MLFEKESNVIKKKNRSIYMVILAAVFGILAFATIAGGVRSYLNLVPVWGAAKDIPQFNVIKDTDLVQIHVPKEYATGTNDKSKLVGKATRTIIPAGKQIETAHLIEKGDGSLLSAKLTDLEDGKLRAFTIPVEALAAVGGDVEPGDMIDIVATLTVSIPQNNNQISAVPQGQGTTPTQASKDVKEVISKIIAKQVLVLKRLGQGSETVGIDIAADPQQIQEIHFAMNAGKIAAALNPYNSNPDASNTKTTTVKSFVEKYANDLLIPKN